MPAKLVPKMSENAFRIWSVMTNVPAIIAVPSTIAITVSTVRSLWLAHAAERVAGHRAASSAMIAMMSDAAWHGASRTIRPSARNSARSAIGGGVARRG